MNKAGTVCECYGGSRPATCSAVLLALENEIEFSNAAAHHCGIENLDQLFQFWHGRANGITAALNIIKKNSKDRSPKGLAHRNVLKFN
jgi:hypothetical protein